MKVQEKPIGLMLQMSKVTSKKMILTVLQYRQILIQNIQYMFCTEHSDHNNKQ